MKVCAGIDLFSFSIEVVWKMVFENVGETWTSYEGFPH